MPNKKKLGGECKLYRNSGTYGSPTWNEITNAVDVSLDASKGAGEFKTRADAWVAFAAGKISAGLNVKYVYDPGDDDWSVLRDAFLNNTVIGFAMMDGAIATTGNQGLRIDCQIHEFPIDQPLEEGVTVQIKLMPAISDNAPAWYTVP